MTENHRRLIATGLVGLAAVNATRCAHEEPPTQEAAVETTSAAYTNDGVVVLDQGWSEADRNSFYHAPQGSPIMPYEMFLALEQHDSETLFRELDHFRDLGMVYWGTSALNPDGLPIGLTIDRGMYGDEAQLGMACAACHVTEIQVDNRTVLVDGGVSHFDFWTFMERLLKALQTTHSEDAKFDRFADRLLPARSSFAQKAQLRARLRGVMRHREEWSLNNVASVRPGPGRVDALNVILNQVTAKMIDRPDNARLANAPVSYPFVWDAPYLTHVQYNGVVPNANGGALGRNIGQVLGVFGQVSLAEAHLPSGYASSVRVDALLDLEKRLETLVSPRWQEAAADGILPTLDPALAEKGQDVYASECASCHQVIDSRNRGDLASVAVPLSALPDIGTDPAAAMSFAAREVATGPLEGRKSGFFLGDPLCERTHANALLAHMTLGVIAHDLGTTYKEVSEGLFAALEGSMYAEMTLLTNTVQSLLGLTAGNTERKRTESDQEVIARMRVDGASEEEIAASLEARSVDSAALYDLLVRENFDFHGKDVGCMQPLEDAQYRARPLNGIWATGPFLHNGSVPTLADLLEPVAERPTQFTVGNTAFDPSQVGFMSASGDAGFTVDTSISGNSNAGHTYGTSLSSDDRTALLEYLKSL